MRSSPASTSRLLRVVAGFQVSISGRFWVSTEDRGGPPTLDAFRAPSDDQEQAISEGRFNHAGQAHWYLADSAEGAIAEVLDGGEGVVRTQKFDVTAYANVLDLYVSVSDDDAGPVVTPDSSEMALALVLMNSNIYERVERKRAWKPGYLLPRFVMDAAKMAGFTGIRYRSVRSFDTMNLVLFDRTWPAE